MQNEFLQAVTAARKVKPPPAEEYGGDHLIEVPGVTPVKVFDPMKPAPPELVARAAADIEVKPVHWLWQNRIPRGMISLIDGLPSDGKTSISVNLASHITTGRAFPGWAAPTVEPSSVLFLAAEDSPEHTLKPRLMAAGADLRKCFISDCTRFDGNDRSIRLPDDIETIERFILDRGIVLVVLDPLLGFLAAAIDSHKDSDCRQALQPLKQLAERTGAGILGLRHPNKSNAGPAMLRGMGSIAFTAVARSAMLVGPHPTEPDVRVLATTKTNIARVPKSITYTIEDVEGFPVIEWGEESDLKADDIGVVAGKATDGARDAAMDFLRDVLRNGPLAASSILTAGENAGFSEKTLKRAKGALGVTSRKSGFSRNGWLWEMPAEGGQALEEGQRIPD